MIIEIIGIISGILVLFGYFGNCFKFLEDYQYHIINIVSASLAIVYLYHHHVMVSVGLNVVWLIIAIVSLIKLGMKK